MSEHIPHATLVDYWADDLAPDAQDQVEEHLIGCDACTQLSARVAALASSFRSMIPPVISAEGLHALENRGLRVVENPMTPGQRSEAHFPLQADLLVHRLGGLACADATRVDFSLRVEGTDQVVVAVEDVPFDREHGSILIACQKHYAFLPPDQVAEVRVHGARGEERVTEYTILHRFPST